MAHAAVSHSRKTATSNNASSAMPPAAGAPEASRPWFTRLRELAAAHGLAELSMGTTQDYRVAAEEGATYVRVGSILFGH